MIVGTPPAPPSYSRAIATRSTACVAAAGWRIAERLLRRFADAARAVGATPVCLVIPNRDVVESPPSRFAPLERLILDAGPRLELPVLGLSSVFEAEPEAVVVTFFCDSGERSVCSEKGFLVTPLATSISTFISGPEPISAAKNQR